MVAAIGRIGGNLDIAPRRLYRKSDSVFYSLALVSFAYISILYRLRLFYKLSFEYLDARRYDIILLFKRSQHYGVVGFVPVPGQ